jgi:hypothetical protein
MIPTLTVLRKPSFGVLPSDRPMLKSINSTFSVDLSLSNSSFFGGFVSTKGVCERNRVQGLNKMVKASAFKRGDDDEGVRVLQQETFVDGSPKFRRELMADGLEPTLNRMVGNSRFSRSRFFPIHVDVCLCVCALRNESSGFY